MKKKHSLRKQKAKLFVTLIWCLCSKHILWGRVGFFFFWIFNSICVQSTGTNVSDIVPACVSKFLFTQES